MRAILKATPAAAWRFARRRAPGAFLAVLVPMLVVDAMPTTCLVHQHLRARIRRPLDLIGLGQGSWTLFAPEVDKTNSRLTAEVKFADGGAAEWRSPDWPRQSLWRRFLGFRRQEYYDNLRFDRYRAAWPFFAAYLGRTTLAASGRATTTTQVVLRRHWGTVAPPQPGQRLPPPGPWPITSQQIFFTWKRPP